MPLPIADLYVAAASDSYARACSRPRRAGRDRRHLHGRAASLLDRRRHAEPRAPQARQAGSGEDARQDEGAGHEDEGAGRKAKPARVPLAKPKPAEPAAPAVDANGLPRVLSAALAGNRVVVVGLHDPDSALDQTVLAEARAGARAAGAGFVAINVFAEAQSRPLLSSSVPWRTPGSSSIAGPTSSLPG